MSLPSRMQAPCGQGQHLISSLLYSLNSARHRGRAQWSLGKFMNSLRRLDARPVLSNKSRISATNVNCIYNLNISSNYIAKAKRNRYS